ncbi:MAG: hypothetical protein HY591_03610 [Candidatus Omnitrophica bacterium]|nr:hypothetical protein [Candidatus Omnitrophota bacterium]
MNNIFLLVVFSILEAVQVLIITAYIYSFIPIRWSAPVPADLRPERESFLYLIFLFAAFALIGAAAAWMRPQLEQENKRRQWSAFLALESMWVFLELFAFFKWVTYRYPFYNVLPYENGHWVRPFFYGTVILSILSKVFWPEIYRFCRDFYPRWRAFALSAAQRRCAYAAMAAFIFLLLLPNVDDVLALDYAWDQFNHWDDCALTRWLMTLGLDHGQTLRVLFAVMVMVWTLVFIAVERWLGSFWLAVFAVLLGIKVNLFHYGLAPVAWIFPDATILNQGINVMSWRGMDNAPMFDALRVRQFFSFFMGFALPVFYVFTILILISGRFGPGLARKSKIAVMAAAWGLFIYANYISRPMLFYYGAVGVPAVLLVCFWLEYAVGRLWPAHRKLIFFALALLALGALLTNRLFVAYPRAFPLYGQNFSKERQLFKRSFDLSPDAQLIGRLTKAGRPVAVIGSFELALLRQARRPAFFKHAPLMRSAILHAATVGGLRLKKKDELLDVMNQMEQVPPEHIFIENKLLGLPPDFYQGTSGLAILLSFARNHYQPAAQGKYFSAWQRVK